MAAASCLTRSPFTPPCNNSNIAWYAALVKLGSTKDELFADPALTEVRMVSSRVRALYDDNLYICIRAF